MSEDKRMKCPECNGNMVEGKRLFSYGGVSLAKKGDLVGDRINPYFCEKCGLIKLYRRMKG